MSTVLGAHRSPTPPGLTPNTLICVFITSLNTFQENLSTGGTGKMFFCVCSCKFHIFLSVSEVGLKPQPFFSPTHSCFGNSNNRFFFFFFC